MKKYFMMSLMSLGLVLGSAQAKEIDLSGALEVGAFGGYGFIDEYSNTGAFDNAPLAGVRLGYHFTDWLALEGSTQRIFSEAASGADVNLDSIRGNILLNLLTKKVVRPFVTVGAGLERTDASTTENDLGLNAGGGMRFLFTKWLSARAEARYNHVKVDGAFSGRQHNLEFLGGLSMLLGASTNDMPAQPVDSDADGIPDDADKCPGTRAGDVVDATGCVVKAEVKKEMDEDADNVVDSKDNCPSTPAGVEVDSKGCPLDSDNDGIADFKDKCPGTKAGEKIDDLGCPARVAKARGALTGVNFVTAKDELTENSKTILNGVASVLKEFNTNAEVQGHTDSTGSVEGNNRLSQARAEAVKQYLISQGVAAERLQAKGYGSSVPVAENTTKEGRLKNRRVELKWLD